MKAKKIPRTVVPLHKITKAASFVGKTVEAKQHVSISKAAVWSGDVSLAKRRESLPAFPSPLLELERHRVLWDLKQQLTTSCEPSAIPLLVFERWHARCLLAQSSSAKAQDPLVPKEHKMKGPTNGEKGQGWNALSLLETELCRVDGIIQEVRHDGEQ